MKEYKYELCDVIVFEHPLSFGKLHHGIDIDFCNGTKMSLNAALFSMISKYFFHRLGEEYLNFFLGGSLNQSEQDRVLGKLLDMVKVNSKA